ncbi:hypothetical protein [Streptomyces sp. NPDC006193]|uniref:hypothetical protein n=1 Tax=Streptomyces sp. NPDC006193 TaxID=3155717 RepID=UPI0033B9672C
MNHGPDDKGPERLGPDLDGLDGLGAGELDLRRLLHSAVDGLEPRSGALDHLRRAVPARRARKRQAMVGMAAAALFLGTAVPALVHVSHAGSADPDTAIAGQSSQAHGGTGRAEDKDAGQGGAKDSDGAKAEPGEKPGRHHEKGEDRGSGGSTVDSGRSVPPAAGNPPCTAAQLGSATGTAGAPDTAGVVYGSFRVTNTSGTACTVAGPGSVTPAAQGAADPARIAGARHTAGDAATALPDPSQEVASLVLQPGTAYEERFAFVPSEACPTGGGDPGGSETGAPSPDPTPSQDAGASGGTTDTGGTGTEGATTQLGSEDGPADGSVAITHTAQPGSPSATAVVPGACAGTVYYTGILPAS